VLLVSLNVKLLYLRIFSVLGFFFALLLLNMDIFIYLILFIIFFGTLYYLKKRRVFELGKQFIGPPTIPLLGNGNLFVNVKPESMIF